MEEAVFTIAQTECYLVHVPSQTVVLLTDEPSVLKVCKSSLRSHNQCYQAGDQFFIRVGDVHIPLQNSSCTRAARGMYLFSKSFEDQETKIYLISFSK